MYVYKFNETNMLVFGLVPLKDYWAWTKYKIETYKKTEEDKKLLMIEVEKTLRSFIIKTIISSFLCLDTKQVTEIKNITMGSIVRSNASPHLYLLFEIDNEFTIAVCDVPIWEADKGAKQLRTRNYDENEIGTYLDFAFNIADNIFMDCSHKNCDKHRHEEKNENNDDEILSDGHDPFKNISLNDFTNS